MPHAITCFITNWSVVYFFINYKIIQEIVRKNKYEIFYYEELDLGNAHDTLTNNNYEELIANIELVNASIKKYLR